MQYYKVEGFSNSGSIVEEDIQRSSRELVKRIAKKAGLYNREISEKAFFYVVDAGEDSIVIGIIQNEFIDIEKQLNAFLTAIDVKIDEQYIEETTFNSMKKMLSHSSRNSYIDDSEEVMEQFQLDELRWLHIDFEERILYESTKAQIYKNATRILSKDSLLPELDRIYSGRQIKQAYGHPVHYITQSDDEKIQKDINELLLQALYSNQRIYSKRYTLLDLESDERFSLTALDSLYRSCTGGSIVVRYRANDNSESNYASGGRDTITKLCEVMKRYRNQVLTILCLPREATKSKEIFYENLGNTTLVELSEEYASGQEAKNFLKMLAKRNSICTDKKLFSMLDNEQTYLAPDLRNIFDEWYYNKLKTGVYPQYKNLTTVKHEIVKSVPKGLAYDDLMEMVGLEKAKDLIKEALDYFKAQSLFSEKGMKTDRPSMHMVFTGNPGTAKTTVARLFARIMKDNHLLSKGNLIEVGRGDLVGKYVGWTAPTIKKKFREAIGSVLFIDEAYSLVDDIDGSFSDEAINTIVQEMENHREDVVVIFAGYPDKMEQFLQKNPGLRSRIAYHIPFADYNTEELCQIAKLVASKKGLTLAVGAIAKLSDIFEEAHLQSDFGNGRYVRNIIEKAKMKQASRLLSMDYDSVTKMDITTILAEDIETPSLPKEQKKRIGFCD